MSLRRPPQYMSSLGQLSPQSCTYLLSHHVAAPRPAALIHVADPPPALSSGPGPADIASAALVAAPPRPHTLFSRLPSWHSETNDLGPAHPSDTTLIFSSLRKHKLSLQGRDLLSCSGDPYCSNTIK